MKTEPPPTAPARRPAAMPPPGAGVFARQIRAAGDRRRALPLAALRLGPALLLCLHLAASPACQAGEEAASEAAPPPSHSTAREADERFLEANAAFAAGRFEEAERGYRDLVEAGIHSAELFYNLGTTRYRQEAPGEAMLWLRRALVLDPGFDEARQNIDHLRARIPYLVFEDRFAERWLRSLRPGYGRWAISMCLWIALIAAGAPFALPKLSEGKGRFLTLAAISLVFAAFFWRVQHLQQNRYAPEAFAIVVAGDARALTGPSPDSREVIELPPGSEVRVLERSGAWAYLEIPGRLRGWARAEQVEGLWPVP